MLTKNSPKSPKYFNCTLCDYLCSKQSDYVKHNSTLKHIAANNANNNANVKIADKKDYKCNNCDLILKHLSSLSRHKKKCLLTKTPVLSCFENIKDSSLNEIKVFTEGIDVILKDIKGSAKQTNENIRGNQKIEIERESEDNIKIYRPKKIYGDIPGIKKRGYIKTSKEIEGTKSVKEENANYIYYNLYEVIDDTIKIMRDIHQNPDYIKWIQINYNTNTNINKTINNLPKLMQTYSFSISNKKRIESINNYKLIINSKLYNNNEIKLNFKSKNNFKINLIEELYINIIYILHNNLHNYDVDKFFALLNSLLKENTKKIYDYFVTKTLDNDNYCICI